MYSNFPLFWIETSKENNKKKNKFRSDRDMSSVPRKRDIDGGGSSISGGGGIGGGDWSVRGINLFFGQKFLKFTWKCNIVP